MSPSARRLPTSELHPAHVWPVLAALIVVACGRGSESAPSQQSAARQSARADSVPLAARADSTLAAAAAGGESALAATLPDSAAIRGAVLVRVIDSLRMPESVAIGPDGRYYVSTFGVFGGGRDGTVTVVDPATGKRSVYVSGLLDPCGIAFAGDTLWIADRNGVLRATAAGEATMVAPLSRFPRHVYFLNDIAIDRDGTVLVTDTGDETKKTGGGVYRIQRTGVVTLVNGSEAAVGDANGIVVRPDGTYWVTGYNTGRLVRRDPSGHWHQEAEGFGGPDGLAFDGSGRMFITDNKGGTLWMVSDTTRGAPSRRSLATGLKQPADLVVDSARARLVVPELNGNRIGLYRMPG